MSHRNHILYWATPALRRQSIQRATSHLGCDIEGSVYEVYLEPPVLEALFEETMLALKVGGAYDDCRRTLKAIALWHSIRCRELKAANPNRLCLGARIGLAENFLSLGVLLKL